MVREEGIAGCERKEEGGREVNKRDIERRQSGRKE